MNTFRFFRAVFTAMLLTAILFVSCIKGHAQPLPSVPFNANDPLINPTGQNPEVISISGVIPEFIEFTAVDNVLEMGNLGGPLATGDQISTSSVASPYSATNATVNAANPHSGSGFVGLGPGENGASSVEFRANTYIRIETLSSRLRNNGPDNIRNTADDVILTTRYARSIYGANARQNNNLSADNANRFRGDLNVWAGAGGDGKIHSTLLYGPTTKSGFVWLARVTRNGLNNLSGDYTAALTMTYYKY